MWREILGEVSAVIDPWLSGQLELLWGSYRLVFFTSRSQNTIWVKVGGVLFPFCKILCDVGKLRYIKISIKLMLWIFLKTQCICPFHDGWFMCTPAHTMLNFQQFLTKNSMTSCPIHLSYSADLTPSDFLFLFCFPAWKMSSKGNVLPLWKRWNKKWQKL